MPRRLALAGGDYRLPEKRLIVLDGSAAQASRFAALRLQTALREIAGLSWEIVAGSAVPKDQVGVMLSIVPGSVGHPQGYELTIAPEGIHVVAGTAAGAFYAVCTLIQLLTSTCPASNLQLPASSPPHLRLAGLPRPRGDVGRQPGSGADDGDAA